MGGGEVVSFTTLLSPPEGFRSPLHIALVDLVGGARLVCHEAVGNIYYFSHLGALDRAKLFWRRAGRAGERMSAIAQSLAKRAWKGRLRGES